MTEYEMPTIGGVLAARDRIKPFLAPTPLYNYPALDRLVGTDVWVKHENHQPVGAFKVRGGVNLAATLSPDEKRAGLISASTGNHGQSIAYSARLFGLEARICVPEGANEAKVRSMQDMGAEVIFHGKDFDDAREHCEQLAKERGYRYVHSGNEPHLIEGVGTLTAEILDEHHVEVLIVPVGGGSGAAGACIAGKGLNTKLEVIGVQSAAAPTAYRTWRERQFVADKMETAAEGLATRTAFELPQKIMWEMLDDFVLVSEDDIKYATIKMIEVTRNLVEGAGAASLAAALQLRERLAGRPVAIVCSGGNITLDQLRALLA